MCINCLIEFFIFTASWKTPLLIAALLLVPIVILVITFWCRLRERQRGNEESETRLQENAPRGREQREEESREDKEERKYSRIKYVGSFKDSAEAGASEVMV